MVGLVLKMLITRINLTQISKTFKQLKTGLLLSSQQGLKRKFQQDDMTLQLKDGPLQQTRSCDADLFDIISSHVYYKLLASQFL